MNDNYLPHGKKVSEHYANGPGVIALEKRWRQHFLKTMKPEFLPPLWSVDHQQERLDIRAQENRIETNDYNLANGIK